MSTTRIKIVPLSDAEPSMVLMRDVVDARGRILLRTGVALTEQTIASLQRRDIGHICIAITDQRDENELASERRQTVAHLNELFRNVRREGYMGALYHMVVKHRLKDMAL